MIQRIEFDAWKAEFVPRIYEDSGAECDEHGWECECEFLYPFEYSELNESEEGEDSFNAVAENRVWTWLNDGRILSGIHENYNLLVTKQPWTGPTEII